ncbi:MAG: DUF2110 family protein [Candidatus Hodarchaeota archaeon]
MEKLKITLLDHVEITRSRNVNKKHVNYLRDGIHQSLEAFELNYEIKEIKKEEFIEIVVDLEGEDAIAARNYLNMNFGLQIPTRELETSTLLHRSKVNTPGSVGFGLFFNIGLSSRKNALSPVYRMREQLVKGQKVPARKIIKAFGICEGFGFDTKVLKIEDSTKISVELTDENVKLFHSWMNDGLDRIFCHGALMDEIERAFERHKADKRHYMIDNVGFLDNIITCDKNTKGIGLVSLIGPSLSHVKMSVFNPEEIRKLMQ